MDRTKKKNSLLSKSIDHGFSLAVCTKPSSTMEFRVGM